MIRRNLRLLLTSVGMVGGLVISMVDPEAIHIQTGIPGAGTLLIVILGTLIGGLIGFFLYPLATWTETRLAKMPLPDILSGVAGLVIGLLIAMLVSAIIKDVPLIGSLLAVLSAVILGYLGTNVAARKREELAGLFSGWPGGRSRSRNPALAGQGGGRSMPKILDTSVIIDGRIADVVTSGFLEGPLVIPNVVLEELRHIADSSDMLKRNRGRRGLDILNRIQKESDVEVQIYEEHLGDAEVDSKLLKLARILNGKVVTNDFNLNKVAELQGVAVLNINELANAVKPAVLPGEDMTVAMIKDGKEPGQGVAYLDDGTMIVVDGGKRYIGETIVVTVTSVLQTAAGRMIFARPRSGSGLWSDSVERPAERVAP